MPSSFPGLREYPIKDKILLTYSKVRPNTGACNINQVQRVYSKIRSELEQTHLTYHWLSKCMYISLIFLCQNLGMTSFQHKTIYRTLVHPMVEYVWTVCELSGTAESCHVFYTGTGTAYASCWSRNWSGLQETCYICKIHIDFVAINKDSYIFTAGMYSRRTHTQAYIALGHPALF